MRTLCKGDLRKVRLMFLFQFCFPGAPAIYYGDEIGLEGGKDPDSRRAFPWDSAAWDKDTHDFVRQLASLRRDVAPLRRGDFAPISVPPAQGVFARRLGSHGARHQSSRTAQVAGISGGPGLAGRRRPVMLKGHPASAGAVQLRSARHRGASAAFPGGLILRRLSSIGGAQVLALPSSPGASSEGLRSPVV
jgi:hypothetical protein